jgi:hypothetical protein
VRGRAKGERAAVRALLTWPTKMACGGRWARSRANASASGNPFWSRISFVRPVSSVM